MPTFTVFYGLQWEMPSSPSTFVTPSDGRLRFVQQRSFLNMISSFFTHWRLRGDPFLTMERYSLSEGGTVIGETSIPSNEVLDSDSRWDDPDITFPNTRWGSGSFVLEAGSHTLTVDTTVSGISNVWGASIRVTLFVPGGGGTQTFDQWNAIAFAAGTPESERAPEKNPDNNELNKAMEFLTGSDPEMVEGAPFESDVEEDSFVVSYLRSTSVPAGAEVVETSGTIRDDWDENDNAMIETESVDAETDTDTDRVTVVTVTLSTTGLFGSVVLAGKVEVIDFLVGEPVRIPRNGKTRGPRGIVTDAATKGAARNVLARSMRGENTQARNFLQVPRNEFAVSGLKSVCLPPLSH